jgi:hypothetical protein
MLDQKEFSAPERKVWDAFPYGRLVSLKGDQSDRRIRAETLVALLSGVVPAALGHVAQVCVEGAIVVGKLDLRGADIKHRLSLFDSELPDGIDLEEAVTKSVCLAGCHIAGLNLRGARIGGRMDLTGARLDGSVEFDSLGNGVSAISGDGLVVEREMFCRDGFHTRGAIRLVGAEIGGDLDMSAAHLDGLGGTTLNADGLTVKHSLFFTEGFSSLGEIRLTGARIGGDLVLSSAHLSTAGAENDGYVFTAPRLVVEQALFMRDGFQVQGKIDFAGAQVNLLCDDPTCWPQEIAMDGFCYSDLDPHLSASWRLEWIKRGGDFRAQPYEQLAAYYRRLGQDEQARKVLLAKCRRRNRRYRRWTRPWGWFQDGLSGYGYAPGRTSALLLIVLVIGTVYFKTSPPPALRVGLPPFNPLLYTLDLLLPTPDLGQESARNPAGLALIVATFLKVSGWLLTIAIVASVTRSLSRT